jgi:uncharacterized protein
MMTDAIDVCAAFAFFSVLGWLIEVCYRWARAGRFVNPGLLTGPYLILYGTGALLLIGAGGLLSGTGIAVRAAAYLALLSGLELASGLAARRLFHVRLWDYSGERFNYRGHICLKFSLYWLAAAFVFEYLVYPAYARALSLVPPGVIAAGTTAAISVMAADFAVVVARRLAVTDAREREARRRRYELIARPLLEHPDVARLSRYPHHLAKSRLDHVNDVAWMSFVIGEALSLDVRAIVRGALLHDLFYYDWLTEGPRLHGFRHPRIALENARGVTGLTRVEEDIIKKHMWPLTVVPPFFPESLVVSFADTACAVLDYLSPKNVSGAVRTGLARHIAPGQALRTYARAVRGRRRG